MSEKPIWIVRGRRPSVDWRVFLETDDEARAEAHLERLRANFIGLTEYERVRKSDADAEGEGKQPNG